MIGQVRVPPPVHDPLVQVCPSAQPRPHFPQWCTSVFPSTHAPSQTVSPSLQPVVQAPFEHTCPAPQALPQAPQCELLEASTTHAPPQLVSPSAQMVRHWPREHMCSGGQAFPHAPQWVGLEVTSTHAPSQLAVPAGHAAAWHTPSRQLWPDAQRSSQPPHATALVRVSKQAPPHVVSPSPQDVPHRRCEQTDPVEHPVPHAPQWRASLDVSTQDPPQFVSPWSHATSAEESPPLSFESPHDAATATATRTDATNTGKTNTDGRRRARAIRRSSRAPFEWSVAREDDLTAAREAHPPSTRGDGGSLARTSFAQAFCRAPSEHVLSVDQRGAGTLSHSEC